MNDFKFNKTPPTRRKHSRETWEGGQNIDFFNDLVNLVVMVGIDTNLLVVLVLLVNKYATYVWYKWYKQQEHI